MTKHIVIAAVVIAMTGFIALAYGQEPLKITISKLYINADCEVNETRLQTDAPNVWSANKTVKWHLEVDGDNATLAHKSATASASGSDHNGYTFYHQTSSPFGSYKEIIRIKPHAGGFTGETSVIRKRWGKEVFALYGLDAVCQ